MSPELQLAFEQLLDRQQQPGSPDYHRWLTPVEVGERFGVSTNDIAAVTNWLASENLQVESASNSRVLITFSGSAAAAGAAFGAPMHRYMVNGEQRVSIASEPSIPAALAPVIRAVSGLYTVKFQSTPRVGGGSLPALFPGSSPAYTVAPYHYLSPADFATIYDLNPVYSNGINGAGQTIAIVGFSRVDNADIEAFQTLFGLPVQDPTVVVPPNGVDPGPPQTTQVTSPSLGQSEATLDVTRAGSVAPGATIDLVVSAETATEVEGVTGPLYVASQYVVDTNPVPAQIMSTSFGVCEGDSNAAFVAAWDTLYSQAAAEGISVFVCSDDSGAAGCDGGFAAAPATQFASPNALCASSYATCVGGTEFADATNPSQYWSATNGANWESALGYIPEGGWNDPLVYSSGSPLVAASGGGVSSYIPTPVGRPA
ncbi:MAG: protease pro-enzyme activation domain-containing protein [Bryobacteraceae bacterium]|jgi:subtilase family serine protease